MRELICAITSALSTLLAYLLGGFDTALLCLVIAIVLDFITGVIKAYITKEIASATGFKGLLKKVCFFIIVSLAVVIDRVTINDGTIRTLVIYYFVANEGFSILENLAIIGVPIPAVIKDSLKVMQKKGKGKK